jgi:pimeloyl-ACP methyl ester carboxylesterase
VVALGAPLAGGRAERPARRVRRIDARVLLLWADRDRYHPLAAAEEALDLLPDAQLRVLPGTGFLMAYDDPVGVARELTAFCL